MKHQLLLTHSAFSWKNTSFWAVGYVITFIVKQFVHILIDLFFFVPLFLITSFIHINFILGKVLYLLPVVLPVLQYENKVL